MTQKGKTPKDDVKLSDMLCFALYSTHHAMTRLYKKLLSDTGLTYPQFAVLMTLWESDDQFVSDLGSALFLESNTLTPLLKRLENMGYVIRHRDSDDERKVRVSLTADGRDLQNKTLCIPESVLDASGLSLSDAKALINNIKQLREQLFSYSKK